MQILKHEYSKFMPRFMQALFEPGELVRITHIPSKFDIRNARLKRDAAIDRLLQFEHTPNVYFACSAFNDVQGYGQANCISTRSVCLDIDCGSEGHAEAAFFDTLEDAYTYVMTAPLRPSGVWSTGHGLDVLYRLQEPLELQGCSADRNALIEYKQVVKALANMMHADSAITPEHLFRVPMTLNDKPETPLVCGSLLHWDEQCVHSWAEIARIRDRYDIPDEALRPKALPVDDNDDEDRIVVPYEDLPQELRDELESEEPRNRSDAWHRLICRMWDEGYAENVIRQAMTRHFNYPDRYEERLDEEFERSLSKIRGRARAYADTYAPIEPSSDSVTVPLCSCSNVSDDMGAMLEKYGQAAGIEITDRIRKSARFHEHLFKQHASGLMETPCGFGKSVWAQCHIAGRACEDEPYLYVTDTLEALHRAASMLEKLNPELSVGRYHGFDADGCYNLCGERHDWRECSPTNKERVCRTCATRSQCEFFNRERELQKAAVLMCHNGLVRLLENKPAALDGRNIIIDEDLNAFLTAEFKLEDIRLVQRYLHRVGVELGGLLPYTRLDAVGNVELPQGSQSFAGLNYILRDEQDTAALTPLVEAMRKGLGAGFLDPFSHSTGEIDHVQHVLLELINFFRPSVREDSCYSYREILKGDHVSYVCKKSRFSFGAGIPGRRLWILNASAELSTVPYPEGLSIHKCSDLQPNSPLVTLHIIQGNPMRSKRQAQVAMAAQIIRDICVHRRHKAVFVATDRKPRGVEEIEEAVRQALGNDATIKMLPRGRIRGSNEAGDCTLACLATMSLFTTIDNVALSTAIGLRRTLPTTRVFSKSGVPRMPGGRFKIAAMQKQFAFAALDEIYQTIYRSAVRNDKPVEAIVAMPDAEWISLLWRTVMPGFRFNAVYKTTEKGFQIDDAMSGLLGLMMMTPGEEITKKDIAIRMGYSKTTGWKDRKNRARMRLILEPFFEDVPDNVQRLRRR